MRVYVLVHDTDDDGIQVEVYSTLRRAKIGAMKLIDLEGDRLDWDDDDVNEYWSALDDDSNLIFIVALVTDIEERIMEAENALLK